MNFEKTVGKMFFPTVLCIVLSVSIIKVLLFTDAQSCDNLYEGELFSCEYIDGFVYNSCKCKENQLIFIYKGDFLQQEKIMLYTYKQSEKIKSVLEKGAYIRIYTPGNYVKVPETASNFGEFDNRKYLASQKIKYIITPEDNSIKILNKRKNVTLLAADIRNSIKNTLSRNIGKEKTGVAMAIITGDTSGISSSSKEAYRNTGISHVMAVSGMHVGFVQWAVTKMLSRRYVHYSARSAISVLVLVMYAAIADFSPSVTRAMLQSGYLLTAKALKKPASGQNALFFACIVQLMNNPYLLFNSGFILSYGAAASMLYLLPILSCKVFAFGTLPRWLASGLSVNIGLFPLLVTYFNSFSFIGIIATLFASKIAGAICVSGLGIWLLGYLPLGAIFMKLSAAITSVAVIGLNFISETGSGIPPPFGLCTVPSMGKSEIVLYYLIVIIFFNKRFIKYLRKNYILTIAVIIAVVATKAVVFRRTEVHFFDVGQGLSVLYKCDGIAGLVDTGEGDVDVSALLLKQGVGELDFVLLTHGHSDHTGGFEKVAKEHKIRVLVVPDNPQDTGIKKACKIAEKFGIEIMQISERMQYESGRTRLTFYLNKMAVNESNEDNLNNASVVMIAENSDGTAIFTGDIEEKTENFLTERKFWSEADVLQVAHHGADTGTLDKNISIISPEYAIISVGKNNSYGHPSERVLKTLEDAGAAIFRSDLSGAIRVTMRKGTVRVWQKLKT